FDDLGARRGVVECDFLIVRASRRTLIEVPYVAATGSTRPTRSTGTARQRPCLLRARVCWHYGGRQLGESAQVRDCESQGRETAPVDSGIGVTSPNTGRSGRLVAGCRCRLHYSVPR